MTAGTAVAHFLKHLVGLKAAAPIRVARITPAALRAGHRYVAVAACLFRRAASAT